MKETAGSALQILVVDDNTPDRIALDVALEGVGATITNVRSGIEALHRLLEHEYVLILLDVEMPTMDGLVCARMIRARPRSRHVPIIFITAYDQTDAKVREAYELGAVDFLFKPIVPEVLRSKVSVFLDLASQAQQLREHEQREAALRLEEERRLWEQKVLQRQVEEQKRIAEVLAREAEALARNVAERQATEVALARMNADLTDALDQMRIARETAERASRLKTEFLGMVSHELRTPLASLQLQIERLRLEGRSDGETHEKSLLIERMWGSTMRLHELIESLLEYARLGAGHVHAEIADVVIEPLVRDTLRALGTEVERKHLEIAVNVPRDLPTVRTDPRLLRLLLANLLDNAVKFTDAGRVSVDVVLEADALVFSVSDTGPGISPIERMRIFEPFEHLEPVRSKHARGMGLGLPLVRELASLLGGTIELESEVGKGSRFTLRLPVACPLEAAAG